MTDSEPKRPASSLKADDSARAFDILQATSLGVPPPKPAMWQGWGRGNAGYWLWDSQPDEKTCDYTEAQLFAAAAICAAEFEVSRSFPEENARGLVFKLVEAANGQIEGYWRGYQLGAISFIYEAATAYGVSLNRNVVGHYGRGMSFEAGPRCAIQAYNDIRSFPSSLHSLARKIGDW